MPTNTQTTEDRLTAANAECERLRNDLAAANALADEANTGLTAANTRAAAATAQVTTLTEQVGTLQSELATANANNATLTARVSTLESEAASAEERAQQITASLGQPPISKTGDGGAMTGGNILEQLAALDHSKQYAFFQEHKKEIIAARSAQFASGAKK